MSERIAVSDHVERCDVQDPSWRSVDDQDLAASFDHLVTIDGASEVVLGATAHMDDNLASGVRCNLAGYGSGLADQ